MQNQEQENEQKMWSIELGLYPGILLGIRSYDMEDYKIHVLYLPFIDIAFKIQH
jgi:hypothetical protein